MRRWILTVLLFTNTNLLLACAPFKTAELSPAKLSGGAWQGPGSDEALIPEDPESPIKVASCDHQPSSTLPTSEDEVTWFDDIRSFSVSAQISDVSIDSHEICTPHTAVKNWPVENPFGDGTAIQGNVWIVASVRGKWYAATYDWLRPEQVCKGVTGAELGRDQIRRAPLDSSWEPCSGEQVGFIVSTIARNGERGSRNERTPIFWTRWP